jgi:hypothetical protein
MMKNEKNQPKTATTTQKPDKVKISISLDSDVVNGIKNLAEEDDRTFSGYVNKVLKEHIRSFENVME